MNAAWNIERWRLIAVVAVTITIGLLSGHWVIAILIPMTAYISWHLTQLYRLEKWLRKGYKRGKTPHSSGAWESIISEILRIRKQDRKYKKRLAKAAKGYRNTVKALPDAAVVVNHNLEIEWANQFAEHHLGINASRDFGHRITNLIRVPEFLDYLTHSSPKALEMKAPGCEGVTLSVRVIHYGQNQRLILGRDISEPLQARIALTSFIAHASHELRTPLTVTSGYIELLQGDPELPAKFHAPVIQLREQTDHMAHLINDLLILSQLEVRQLTLDEGQIINLPALLAQVLQNLQNGGITQNHEITMKCDDQLGLLGIEREVVSIYSNLIENSCKYTPAGTKIKVNWNLNKQGEPCLSVIDNGPGFENSLIPNLTQRFYRINNQLTADTEGTGLGLAIVKHAVVRHGGSLNIESKPGKSSSFSACFPAYRARKL